jgi:hypothetical protein
MGRLRARITDKRVLALVKAFLKAGIMTADGDREETYTGTPAGGILTPGLRRVPDLPGFTQYAVAGRYCAGCRHGHATLIM